MSEEQTGLGTQFLRENDDEEFEPIAFVAKIGPPELTREMADVEELNPQDQIKKKLPGLIDAGDLTLTVNYDPEEDTHQMLEDDFAGRKDRTYRIAFPGYEDEDDHKGYYDIVGTVSGFAPQEIAASNVIQAEITIAVSAKPEYEEPTA